MRKRQQNAVNPSRRLCLIMTQLPAGIGKRRPPASSCIARPPPRASGAGLRRTSYGTRTPSRWRTGGVPLVVIQRQLGHANLPITSVYLQGIDSSEIISTVHGPAGADVLATDGLEGCEIGEEEVKPRAADEHCSSGRASLLYPPKAPAGLDMWLLVQLRRPEREAERVGPRAGDSRASERAREGVPQYA
jgi:hypothetical protein